MNVKVEWDAPGAQMPEGTPEESYYHVVLGPGLEADLSMDEPRLFIFLAVSPGSYTPTVELRTADHMPIGAAMAGDTIVVPAPAVLRHPPAAVRASLMEFAPDVNPTGQPQ